MMKLISTLSVYSCFLVFIGLTACGDDEAATGESSSTTGALAAPGSSCSCDDDCASVEGQAGFCYKSICFITPDPDQMCDARGAGCPTGFPCWEGFCLSDCDSYNCDGICDEGFCSPTNDGVCNKYCSYHCSVE